MCYIGIMYDTAEWMESYGTNDLFATDESWRADGHGPSDDFWCLDSAGAWDDDLHETADDDNWKEEA